MNRRFHLTDRGWTGLCQTRLQSDVVWLDEDVGQNSSLPLCAHCSRIADRVIRDADLAEGPRP